MRRVLAIFGLVIGLATIGYAVVLFTSEPPAAEGAAAVEPTAIVVEGTDIGETAVHTEVPARVRIHNNSNGAIRFIGGPNGCQPGGCMRTTGKCPLTISPNSVEEIPLSVSVSMLGTFRLAVCVYLDVAGAAVERVVYLSGIGIPSVHIPATPERP
jgi:hypothetical protein